MTECLQDRVMLLNFHKLNETYVLMTHNQTRPSVQVSTFLASRVHRAGEQHKWVIANPSEIMTAEESSQLKAFIYSVYIVGEVY